MKAADRIIIIIFCSFIFGLFTVGFILPDREFSEEENRYLKNKPKLSIEGIVSGEFTKQYEEYLTDQFPFRDSWISLKSISEKLIGKKENNAVYLGKDGYLIEKFDSPDIENIKNNIKYINKLTLKTKAQVYVMLVPNSVEILKNKLPAFASSYPQTKILDLVKENLESKVNTVDSYSMLKDKSNEYIYYKTDHHWTTLGAYYGYQSLMNTMKLKSLGIEEFNIKSVTKEFYGTLYSKSGARFINPDSMDVFIPKKENKLEIDYKDTNTSSNNLYEGSYLLKKDKYSMFLDGNHALTSIKTDMKNKGKILIIKDSYANCMIPFLTNHFSEIHIADMRYLKMDMANYIKDNDIDNVVILYNISNFSHDNNLVWLSN